MIGDIRKEFVNDAAARLNNLRSAASAALVWLEAETAALQKEMHALVREIETVRERRDEVRAGEDFGAEFDSLLRNEKIADIEVNAKGIIITTKQLCIPFKGGSYWVDPLKIVIVWGGSGLKDWHGGIEGVRILKSRPDQKVSRDIYGNDGWPHPHVRGNGTICFGNMQDAVDNAQKAHRWAEVIELIFPFLESCAESHSEYGEILKQVAVRERADDPAADEAKNIRKRGEPW